jgi:4-diphosphocytidyl-2-C-methyl-D-erythritol kinase
MLAFPKAKINLGLMIKGKRPDGYHDIETVFYPVGLCDALELVRDLSGNGKDILTVTGYALQGRSEDNIVVKALKKLREAFPIPPLGIHLHKNIPVGAGLGGGSSDAACMLQTLKKIFGLPLGKEELRMIAGTLGSDSPFFIDCLPAFATGRGESLTPLNNFLSGFHIVLVNPGIQVSTKEAYEECIPLMPEVSLFETIRKPVYEWKDSLFNDFEKSVFIRYPEIRVVKGKLYESGAIYSSMSGSGSTVYGIFNEKPYIPDALRNLVIYQGEL